ncbi:RNA-binding domain-containing [Ceratobasidium sp. AG-Ba]|nr:RNA-binding domain-containing [Ceratobasidium sp. AG-Ba]QRV91347.1 RNA-binding domain-containing [Ceratobasidium sp. AG-Ba]
MTAPGHLILNSSSTTTSKIEKMEVDSANKEDSYSRRDRDDRDDRDRRDRRDRDRSRSRDRERDRDRDRERDRDRDRRDDRRRSDHHDDDRRRRRDRSRSRSRSRSRDRRRSNSPGMRSSRRRRSRSRDRGDRDRGDRFARSLGGPINADPEEAAEMTKHSKKENRVYVGNLSYDVKYGDLMEFMRGGGWMMDFMVFWFLGVASSFGGGDFGEGMGESRLWRGKLGGAISAEWVPGGDFYGVTAVTTTTILHYTISSGASLVAGEHTG